MKNAAMRCVTKSGQHEMDYKERMAIAFCGRIEKEMEVEIW
jgi:hypothetical protein